MTVYNNKNRLDCETRCNRTCWEPKVLADTMRWATASIERACDWVPCPRPPPADRRACREPGIAIGALASRVEEDTHMVASAPVTAMRICMLLELQPSLVPLRVMRLAG
jgi:hypothetical protein